MFIDKCNKCNSRDYLEFVSLMDEMEKGIYLEWCYCSRCKSDLFLNIETNKFCYLCNNGYLSLVGTESVGNDEVNKYICTNCLKTFYGNDKEV